MARTVKFEGKTPANPPKVVDFAQIDDQGRIPYGKTADVAIPEKLEVLTARGMGAAKKGGGYLGYK